MQHNPLHRTIRHAHGHGATRLVPQTLHRPRRHIERYKLNMKNAQHKQKLGMHGFMHDIVSIGTLTRSAKPL